MSTLWNFYCVNIFVLWLSGYETDMNPLFSVVILKTHMFINRIREKNKT